MCIRDRCKAGERETDTVKATLVTRIKIFTGVRRCENLTDVFVLVHRRNQKPKGNLITVQHLRVKTPKGEILFLNSPSALLNYQQ